MRVEPLKQRTDLHRKCWRDRVCGCSNAFHCQLAGIPKTARLKHVWRQVENAQPAGC